MARFPIIDKKCPLSADEVAAIDGDCEHCGKTVHRLDGMTDTTRSDFMGQFRETICISYRLPIRLAAVLALSLAAPVLGQDSQPAPCDAQAAAEPARKAPEDIVVMGTVRDPSNAQWNEDTALPELPTAPDDD